MICLAEADPSPNFWWQFCLCIAAVTHFYYMIMKIMAERRAMKHEGQPMQVAQPLITSRAVEHAERKEMDKISAAVTLLTQTVNTNHTSIIVAGAERENAIKDMVRHEVGAAMRMVSDLKDTIHKEMSLIRERLSSAETRLDKSDS